MHATGLHLSPKYVGRENGVHGISGVVAAVIRGHTRIVCPLLILGDLRAYAVCSMPLLKKKVILLLVIVGPT